MGAAAATENGRGLRPPVPEAGDTWTRDELMALRGYDLEHPPSSNGNGQRGDIRNAPPPPSPGECEECGAPLPASTTLTGRPRVTCGAPECKRQRDNRQRRTARADAGARAVGASTKAQLGATGNHTTPPPAAPPGATERPPAPIFALAAELLAVTGADALELRASSLSVTIAARELAPGRRSSALARLAYSHGDGSDGDHRQEQGTD
jgi:hypothetical protein